MKLVVTGKPLFDGRAGIPAEISVDNGVLRIESRDDDTRETIEQTVRGRYFIAGQGFPMFVRSGAEFARDPKTKRLQLAGYVDLSAPERTVLQAIADNFLIGEQYDLELQEDA